MTKFIEIVFVGCWAIVIIIAGYAQIQISGFTWWLIPVSIVMFLFGQALIEGIFKYLE